MFIFVGRVCNLEIVFFPDENGAEFNKNFLFQREKLGGKARRGTMAFRRVGDEKKHRNRRKFRTLNNWRTFLQFNLIEFIARNLIDVLESELQTYDDR